MTNKVVIEAGEDFLIGKYYSSSLIAKILKRSIGKDFYLNDKRSKVKNLKDKNLYVILHEEEMLIKIFVLPRVRHYELKMLIEGELKSVISRVEDMIFDFVILQEDKNTVKVLVFCLNHEKCGFIKEFDEKVRFKLKRIVPLQISYLECIKKSIKTKNNVITFLDSGNIYMLACFEDKIICNSIIRGADEVKEAEFNKCFDSMLIKYRNMLKSFVIATETRIDKVYAIGFYAQYVDLIKGIEDKYDIVKLKNIKHEELLSKGVIF